MNHTSSSEKLASSGEMLSKNPDFFPTLYNLTRGNFYFVSHFDDMSCRFQVNAHEMPLTEPSYIAIFDRASFIEHNCYPNLYKSFTDSGQVLLRAMKPIAPGDHLSICYTDPLWGTINRRHHLQTSKYFTCQCERCQDPTELNTFYDGVKCPEP